MYNSEASNGTILDRFDEFMQDLLHIQNYGFI